MNNNQGSMGIIIVAVVCIVCVSISSSIIGGGLFAISAGNYVPDWVPNSIKFNKISNHRLIGTPSLVKYKGLSEINCIERCSENIGCLSAVHNPKKKECKLYKLNADIDPDTFTEFDGTNYFQKNYFWSRFTPQQTGTMEDLGGLELDFDEITSAKECAKECLKQSSDPECKGFNYVSSRQYCQLLGTSLKDNENMIDPTDDGSYYGLLEYTINPENQIHETQETFKIKNHTRFGIFIVLFIGIVLIKAGG